MQLVAPLAVALLTLSLAGCTSPLEQDQQTDAREASGFPIVVVFGNGEGPWTVTATLLDDTGNAQTNQTYRLQSGQQQLTPLEASDMPCNSRTRRLQVIVAHPSYQGTDDVPTPAASKETGLPVACDGTPYAIHVSEWNDNRDENAPFIEPVSLYPGWVRGEPWREAPTISFQKNASGSNTQWTVTKVTNGPVPWFDLSVTCSSGATPGGSARDSGNVAAGNIITCTRGETLTIVHNPTDKVIYTQS